MKKLYEFASGKAGKLALVISGAVTAVICVVMNFVLIPQIEASTGGIRCFDMNFAYSYETAVKFLSLIGDDARRVYLTQQLPLDFVYPLAYLIFFSLLIIRLGKRVSPFCALPVMLCASDYCENILTVIILKSGEPSRALIQCASIVTSVKTVLMYTVFLVVIVLIIRYFLAKKRVVNGQ